MSRLRIALVAFVAVALLLLYRAGVFAQFSDAERARQTLLSLGGYGYSAFVLAYAALQPFGVPGTVFILVAPLIWPWPVAFALSLLGTMAASVVGFSFSRFVARDLVAARIPARFRRYDEVLGQRALLTVFLLRLIFWMPPMLHAFFGVSRVSFSAHFLGSLLGYVPPLLITAYFGRRVVDWLRRAPPSLWIWLGVVAAAAGVVYLLLRQHRRAKEAGGRRP
jgi:uncharacterized membrane protein YdjX (TVP38/TMEM64 family)